MSQTIAAAANAATPHAVATTISGFWEAGDDEPCAVDAAALDVLVAALAQAPHHLRLLPLRFGHARA